MVKTTPMDDETHTFFKKTQIALFEKYKINLSMATIMADVSHALRHPEDAASLIFRTRHLKHEDVIASETGNGATIGDVSKSDNVGNNGQKQDEFDDKKILKPHTIKLIEKEDVNT